jgi:hypothetical protein
MVYWHSLSVCSNFTPKQRTWSCLTPGCWYISQGHLCTLVFDSQRRLPHGAGCLITILYGSRVCSSLICSKSSSLRHIWRIVCLSMVSVTFVLFFGTTYWLDICCFDACMSQRSDFGHRTCRLPPTLWVSLTCDSQIAVFGYISCSRALLWVAQAGSTRPLAPSVSQAAVDSTSYYILGAPVVLSKTTARHFSIDGIVSCSSFPRIINDKIDASRSWIVTGIQY